MTKRSRIGLIYFGVIVASLLMRVASALNVYAALGIKTDEGSSIFYSIVVQIFIFGVMPIALYMLTVGREEGLRVALNDLGCKKFSVRNICRTILLSVFLVIITSGVSYVWQLILTLVGYTHVSSPTDYKNIGVLFRELFIVALLPAVFEETAHRGIVYAGFKDSGYKFVLVSALYFSLMHQNIVQTGYTFVAGIMMALAMYYTGSIFPGMIMHFVNNAVSVIGGYVNQNGGAFSFMNLIKDWIYGSIAGLAVGLLMVLASVAMAILLYARMRKDAIKDGIISGVAFENLTQSRPIATDPFFIITVIIGVGATVFSFVWGMLR